MWRKGGGGERANINSYLAYTVSFLLWMTTLSVPMQVRNPPFCHFSLSHTLLLGEGGGGQECLWPVTLELCERNGMKFNRP